MKILKKIDLNADLGEYNSDAALKNEISLMHHITSASIACGGHAGNHHSMDKIIELCKRLEILCGPHPSYPDKDGFGRKKVIIGSKDLYKSIAEQLRSYKEISTRHKVTPTHVKLHGQLYNDCFFDSELSEICLNAILGIFPEIAIMCQPYSVISNQAKDRGLKVIHEAFIDRKYDSQGILIPRSIDNSVITSMPVIIKQALSIVEKGYVITDDLTVLKMKADTLCIHGDEMDASLTALEVKKALNAVDWQVSQYAK